MEGPDHDRLSHAGTCSTRTRGRLHALLQQLDQDLSLYTWLVASVVGQGFMYFRRSDIGGFISAAAGDITAGFSVAYNPVWLSDK